MVTRKTKFSISIEKVKIEFEGSQELGQQIHQGVQQAIGGLMNTQTRLLSIRDQPGQVIDTEIVDGGTPLVPAATDGNGEKQKQQRQRRSRGGTSLVNLLRGLKEEGFFSQPRPVSEILVRLKEKGHICRQDIVSARLKDLTQREELYRATSGEENVYVYKDTPFHESIRSRSPTDQPAE
jgi:hypothetical protein